MAAVLAAASLAIGMSVMSAGPATAAPSGDVAARGTCTRVGPIVRCGRIENAWNSAKYIVTTDNWPASNGNWTWVYPGQRSPFKDTDGFFVPPGCTAIDDWGGVWDGGTWHKINDLFDNTVTLYKTATCP